LKSERQGPGEEMKEMKKTLVNKTKPKTKMIGGTIVKRTKKDLITY
jgi:hypothetical protein